MDVGAGVVWPSWLAHWRAYGVQAARGAQLALAAVLLEHAVPKLEALVAVAYPYRAAQFSVLNQKPGYGCSGIGNIKVRI